jgi:hypothetical protein
VAAPTKPATLLTASGVLAKDRSVRAAVEKIGDELFTIVHRPEKADAVTD